MCQANRVGCHYLGNTRLLAAVEKRDMDNIAIKDVLSRQWVILDT